MAEARPWRSDVSAVVVHPTEPAVWLHQGRDLVLEFRHDDYLWFPDVAPVLGAVRASWNIDAIVLRCVELHADRDARHLQLTYLLQARQDAPPGEGRWTTIAGLDASLLPDDPRREALASALREIGEPLPVSRSPWTVRGWFEEAVAWSDDALRAAGIERHGPPEQMRNWGLSSVIRFDTSIGRVFFKAALFGRPFLFANEAALLAGLGERFPEHLPRPLAVDPARVWMLLPDAGPFLAEVQNIDTWAAALRLHARHQRAFVGQETELTQLGCLDRRLSGLATQLDELLADDVILAYLDPADRERFVAAAPAIHAMIGRLAELDIPDTLVHGDLHAENVGVRDGRAVFFDWTDGCIAHPFFDLATFIDVSEFLGTIPGARERLRDAYLDEWRGVAPAEALAQAARLARPLGALHQVISYQHLVAGLDEPTRMVMGRGGADWIRVLLSHSEGAPG